MDAHRFALACDAFLSLLPHDSGWHWTGGGYLALDDVVHRLADDTLVTSTFHVVYHVAFREPVLYFNRCDASGRIVMPAASGVPVEVISQAEHPVTGAPYFFVHPCQTTPFMASLQSPPALYIYTWLSWVGRVALLPLAALPNTSFEISIIMPVFNAEPFLSDTFDSIARQTWADKRAVQVVCYDDRSTDASHATLQRLAATVLRPAGFTVTVLRNSAESGGNGCGWARNRCIEHALGRYLCLLDADDCMLPTRLAEQHAAAVAAPDALVGSLWSTIPVAQTPFTEWHNTLRAPHQMMAYRFREVSLPQPTWFMSRAVWDRSGPYPQHCDAIEDMAFFYAHLRNQGTLVKVPSTLLQYRIHGGQISKRIHRNVLLRVKAEAFSEWALRNWSTTGFGIWGCGRDGKKFYKFLTDDAKLLVRCFYEIDTAKGKSYQGKVDIVPVESVRAPFVCCVTIGKANGIEKRLAPFEAGVDYFQLT